MDEFSRTHFTAPGLIPVLKDSITFLQYGGMANVAWSPFETFDQKLRKLDAQFLALEHFGCVADRHFRKKPRASITPADFEGRARTLIEWPVSVSNNLPMAPAPAVSVPPENITIARKRVTMKVAKFEVDDPESQAAKNLKKMKKSLNATSVFNWNVELQSSNPLSNKFVPDSGINASIMRKNDGYSKQEKDLYEEEAETIFKAFEKDEPTPLYADGRWKGCTRLGQSEFINACLHHQLKIHSEIDTETKPALHSDFTQIQGKIKQLLIPNPTTYLSVCKLIPLLGVALELLNHSNQLSDHTYALIDPEKLTTEEKQALLLLKHGDKLNRICSTSLLQDTLEFFSPKNSYHNMSKKAFVEWASDFILKYNLWGSKKLDRIRDRKKVYKKLDELPDSFQKAWSKYNRLFLEHKSNVSGKEMKPGSRPEFDGNKKFNRRSEPYNTGGTNRNSYYNYKNWNYRGRDRGRGRGRNRGRGRGRYNRGRPRGNWRGRNNYNYRNRDFRRNDYYNQNRDFNNDFRRNDYRSQNRDNSNHSNSRDTDYRPREYQNTRNNQSQNQNNKSYGQNSNSRPEGQQNSRANQRGRGGSW